MKCLPALRQGQAGWLFPLSVPASDFLAALLMTSARTPERFRSQRPRSCGAQALGGSNVALPRWRDDVEDTHWQHRAVELLRFDWSLRWYVALRRDLAAQEKRCEDAVKANRPAAMSSEADTIRPEVSLDTLGHWLVENARDWFGRGDGRLFSEQHQSAFDSQWYHEWQQAADRFHVAMQRSDTKIERLILCELLEASGHSIPVVWKRAWPVIFDEPAEEDVEEAIGEEEADQKDWECDSERCTSVGIGSIDERILCGGDTTEIEVGESGSTFVEGRGLGLGYGQAMIDLDSLARTVCERESYRERFSSVLHDEKMASLRQLAYGLSHELNNPLAAIRTRAELLQRQLVTEKRIEADEQLRRIVDSAMRAHEMIADMMYFAKPPRLQLRREDAVGLTGEVVDEFQRDCQKASIELRFTSRSPSIVFWGDRLQLEGALRALIRNAIEAVGHSGAIAVHVQKSVQQVQWIVSDSGAGMSSEARRHAFDPYYSGREAGRGLGLGLSRVYRVARSHGGRASVVDTASLGAVGCQIRFWVPRKRPEASAGLPS